jgi:hypothetical protein
MDQNYLIIKLRRRLNKDVIESELRYLLEDSEPCNYSSVGDFISDYCDILKDSVIESLEEEDVEVNPKTKDMIYHYMVELFGKKLFVIYKDACF